VPPKSVAARIEARLHVIRGERVMLDADLAALYGVETGALNLAVRRNRSRFPADFVFQLTLDETTRLRLQIEISKLGRGGRRYLPYAVTEQGVAMLSTVLTALRALERPASQTRRGIGFGRTT
jgi:hypothetical protein